MFPILSGFATCSLILFTFGIVGYAIYKRNVAEPKYPVMGHSLIKRNTLEANANVGLATTCMRHGGAIATHETPGQWGSCLSWQKTGW